MTAFTGPLRTLAQMPSFRASLGQLLVDGVEEDGDGNSGLGFGSFGGQLIVVPLTRVKKMKLMDRNSEAENKEQLLEAIERVSK